VPTSTGATAAGRVRGRVAPIQICQKVGVVALTARLTPPVKSLKRPTRQHTDQDRAEKTKHRHHH
jgi:hypothetical protein